MSPVLLPLISHRVELHNRRMTFNGGKHVRHFAERTRRHGGKNRADEREVLRIIECPAHARQCGTVTSKINALEMGCANEPWINMLTVIVLGCLGGRFRERRRGQCLAVKPAWKP